mgnify:CR=1 FL=1
MENILNTLSIFIDESGDFGKYDPKCPFYIFTLVFHNQVDDISNLCEKFKEDLLNLGFKKPYFHAGPIIRKEEDYKYFQKQCRIKSFNKMSQIIRKMPIKFVTFQINKKEYNGEVDMKLALQKLLNQFVQKHLEYFQKFKRIKLYYDNGQKQLSKILRFVFDSYFKKNIEEYFQANPYDYTLFQVADTLTTIELISLKYDYHLSSRTELEFFGGSKKYFKNNYLDKLNSKRL